MKILVSGATGFIGKNLVKRLLADGHHVTAIIRPSSNTSFLEQKKIHTYVFDKDVEHCIVYLKEQKFDGVIHLASLFLAQHTAADIPGLIDSNVFFSTALLEAASQSSIGWFINTGTFWQHYQDHDYSPVNLYSATKQAFEDIAKYYYETNKINFATLQLSDTFGPGDTRPKIFNLWMKSAKNKEPLDMSPGEQLIDISYIDNVIDGFMRLVKLLASDKERACNGKVYALTSGSPISLKDLAELFQRVTGIKLTIHWGARPYRPREVMHTWSKGETIPGWKPKITIEEGIRRTFHD